MPGPEAQQTFEQKMEAGINLNDGLKKEEVQFLKNNITSIKENKDKFAEKFGLKPVLEECKQATSLNQVGWIVKWSSETTALLQAYLFAEDIANGVPIDGKDANKQIDGILGKNTFSKLTWKSLEDAAKSGEWNKEAPKTSKINEVQVEEWTGKKYMLIDGERYYEKPENGKGYENWKYDDWTTWVYRGDFKNGNREGKGVYTRANGKKYEGDWKNGVQEGKGTFTRPNGDKYVGDFKNDVREGKGVYTRPNGDKYVGDFKNDVCEGVGTLLYKNGCKLSSWFKESRRQWVWIYEYHGLKVDIMSKDNVMSIVRLPDGKRHARGQTYKTVKELDDYLYSLKLGATSQAGIKSTNSANGRGLPAS